MNIKTLFTATIFSILSLALLASQAQAANPKAPSSSSVRKVVKSLSPEKAAIVELPSPTPGTRLFLSDYTGSYQGGENPTTGLRALVSRQFAIVTFFADGQHLFTANGATDSASPWRLSNPSNQDITADDPRIAQFADAVMALGNGSFTPLDVSSEDDAIASAAGYNSTVKAVGYGLYALGKGYQVCNKINNGGKAGSFGDFLRSPTNWAGQLAKALIGKLKINCKSHIQQRTTSLLSQIMPQGKAEAAATALTQCKSTAFLKVWRGHFRAYPPKPIVLGGREIIRSRPCY